MAETDVDTVILLLAADVRKLTEVVNLMNDFSDKEAERKKDAIRLLEDFRKHLAVLQATRG